MRAAPVLGYLSSGEQRMLAEQTLSGADPDAVAEGLFAANDAASRQAQIHGALLEVVPDLAKVDAAALRAGVLEIDRRVQAGEDIDTAANAVLQGELQNPLVGAQLAQSIPSWDLLPKEVQDQLIARGLAGQGFDGALGGSLGDLRSAEISRDKDPVYLPDERYSWGYGKTQYGTWNNWGESDEFQVFSNDAIGDYKTLQAMEARLAEVREIVDNYGQMRRNSWGEDWEYSTYTLYKAPENQNRFSYMYDENPSPAVAMSEQEARDYLNDLTARIDGMRERVTDRYEAQQRLQSEGLIQVTGQHIGLKQGERTGLHDFSQIRWDPELGLVTGAGNYRKKKKRSFWKAALGFIAIAAAVVIGAPYLVPALSGAAVGGAAAATGAGLSLGATMVQAGLVSGGLTLIQGGSLKDALKAGVLGAATAGIGGYLAPRAITALGLSNSAFGSSVVNGMVRSGVSGLINGGDLDKALLQGAAGGIGRYMGGVAVDSLTQFTDNELLLDVIGATTDRVVTDALDGDGFSGLGEHLKGAAAATAGSYVAGKVDEAVDLGEGTGAAMLEDAIVTASGSVVRNLALGHDGDDLWTLVRDDVAKDALQTQGARVGAALFPVEVAETAAAAPEQAAKAAPQPAVLVVQEGDTLWDLTGGNMELIGRIMADNGLTSSLIRPGQELVIRPDSMVSDEEAAAHLALGSETVIADNERLALMPKVVTVREGDTLWDITGGDIGAIGRIMADNGLTNSFIYPGQELVIRPEGAVSAEEAAFHAEV
ncbi:MAG: LysM peptidoglycan-binding domain-containing protein, partial [Hyphomicrobiaceae bacterium]|nr:LysM peptidoglycan-binding domain-containing protein [Hyphomicrobiaceae bacterium]